MTPLLEAFVSNVRLKPWVWILIGAFMLGVGWNRTAAAFANKADKSIVEAMAAELHEVHVSVDSTKVRVRDLACAQIPAKARSYCR